MVYSFRGIPAFLLDMSRYTRASSQKGMRIDISSIYPVLSDRYASAGIAGGHYFFQDLWAAKKIFASRPSRHVDIGSSVEGFIAHLLVFMAQVEVVDVRPLVSNVAGLKFIKDDATLLANFGDNSLESISTLHAAEHFGLGRYGDPVDPDAHVKFMNSLVRVLKPGGRLYFSVPTGRERLEFNAHRILSPNTVVAGLAGLELISFSLVNDNGLFYENASMEEAAQQTFGCGLYEFRKK